MHVAFLPPFFPLETTAYLIFLARSVTPLRTRNQTTDIKELRISPFEVLLVSAMPTFRERLGITALEGGGREGMHAGLLNGGRLSWSPCQL